MSLEIGWFKMLLEKYCIYAKSSIFLENEKNFFCYTLRMMIMN